MKHGMKHALLAATVMAAAFGTITARAQTAADLGRTLTPMGAVKAGNPAGTIAPRSFCLRAPAFHHHCPER
jgi:hypothetical protein